jgi:hypothetical protein
MARDHGRFLSRRIYYALLGATALTTAVALPAMSDTPRALAPTLRELRGTSNGTLTKVEYTGLQLSGGSQLTVIAPREWRPIAARVVANLEETHQHYTTVFGTLPAMTVRVRLCDEETFYLSTGAPRWTNAMYFKGQIVIPLSRESEPDLDNIQRSVRHEYTHAVIHALSKGRCPGWLDEGLAQWAEGSVNPLLLQALTRWLDKNPAVPFTLLQGGFTKLPSEMVPAAYGQSLVGTRLLIQRHGLKQFGDFLRMLGSGKSEEVSFINAFQRDRSTVERLVAGELIGALKTHESYQQKLLDPPAQALARVAQKDSHRARARE